MTGSRDPDPGRWESEGNAGRVALGAAWSTVSSVIVLVSGFALTLVLVRGLPTRAYGALAVGGAIAGILTAIGAMGLGPAVSRFGIGLAEQGESRSATAAAGDAMAAALPAAGVLSAVSLMIGLGMLTSSSLHAAGLVVLSTLPLTALSPYQSVIAGYLVATFRPRLAAAVQVGQTIVQLAFVLLAVELGVKAAYQVSLIRMAIGVGSIGYLMRRAKLIRVARHARRDKSERHSDLIRFGWAMTLTTTAGIAISQLDVLVLGLARGTRAAGLYAPVSRLADTALLLPNAVGAYLLPAVASSVLNKDERTAESHYHWASRWALVIATPGVAALLLTPNEVISVLFGVQDHSLTAPARVLAIGLLTHLFFGFNGMTLDALGDAPLVAVRSGYGVLVSAIACAVLIPVWGALGAAIATSTAILGLNALCSVMLVRRHHIAIWDTRVAEVATAVGLGLVAGWAILPAVADHQYVAIVSVAAVAFAPALALSVGLDWPVIRDRFHPRVAVGPEVR